MKVSKSDSKGPILAGPHLTSCNPLPVERWRGVRGRQELGRERRGGQGKESKPRWQNGMCVCVGDPGFTGETQKTKH